MAKATVSVRFQSRAMNSKSSLKAHQKAYEPLGMSGGYSRMKWVKKANQCLSHGCDCGFSTDDPDHKSGNALNGNRNGDDVNVNQNNADNRNPNNGWRGLLRVYWLWQDFSQPPSMRPVSSSIA
jgi:hypothetical protein